MRVFKKILKMIGIFIASFLLLLAISIFLFLKLNPEFGGEASKERRAEFEKSVRLLRYMNFIFLAIFILSFILSIGKLNEI